MTDIFKDLLDNDPELRRRYELFTKVGAETERGMTILAAAELDRALETLLKSYLVPGKARDTLLGGGSSPLGSFSAKINLARALHLIRDDEYELLHVIRKIRNEFAHNPDAAFSDNRIVSWLEAIPEPVSETDMKSKFSLASIALIAALETDAVRQANGRVYEESYNFFYRRGFDSEMLSFNSSEEAAAAYVGRKR